MHLNEHCYFFNNLPFFYKCVSHDSFIKKLNTKHIIYIIEIWIKEARSLTNKDRAEKLLILNNNSNDENDERILIYLKEHNMKIKRLNYLAYVKGNGVNLSCMKNEAKEFRSYGIQILNYNDSSIQFVDFVKEMY
ncbi:hypothetical protein GLOIN_2v1840882 [Rhizophagus irregularis DAOM 181602=DAOM 197198]|uniref:Uncharacterized protein n=1 Tax=Rhizophagus irregularis (strain DAOM 181602 / DAOM 197198 / MUCL 43194) TaxID=747089 RepID=A0A2P4Q2M4_RHIID|nr:hypothetical protein GLOIN_2v1840882 [Rhizophagus irregularis DAOM 181602=DAOM 197198]POG71842.1 hypothetical protein GLOIN_2v1840882 [Rhizophagus irregularis DAOM 181602=DAOM 197198]|eukprot:XP_025178708.1 hypothetical protein GLOIN_2v1840882 [Rhizophagus irregularis DAOM 181602=DAOM 197198]